MTPIEFKGCNVTYAKNQPQYRPLPCHRADDDCGTLTICWQLSWKERVKLLFTGKLWQQMLTFNRALTPQLLSADKMEVEQAPTPEPNVKRV